MRIRILDDAEDEARVAARWYEEKQSGLGADFLDTLADALATVESHPQAFSLMETFTSSREVRRCVLHRFPYVVVYEVRAEEVIVLAVAHSRRRPNYWEQREG